MRLIDADALEEHKFVGNKFVINDYQQGWNDAIDAIIDNAPTVEYPFYAEAYQTGYEEEKNERPKGKWEYIGQSEVTGLKVVECTNCHKRQYGSMNYCGNCGARMER